LGEIAHGRRDESDEGAASGSREPLIGEAVPNVLVEEGALGRRGEEVADHGGGHGEVAIAAPGAKGQLEGLVARVRDGASTDDSTAMRRARGSEPCGDIVEAVAGDGAGDEPADGGGQASEEVATEPAEAQGREAARGEDARRAMARGGPGVFQAGARVFGELADAERDHQRVGQGERQQEALDPLAGANLQAEPAQAEVGLIGQRVVRVPRRRWMSTSRRVRRMKVAPGSRSNSRISATRAYPRSRMKQSGNPLAASSSCRKNRRSTTFWLFSRSGAGAGPRR
jgi:hypothetical protein